MIATLALLVGLVGPVCGPADSVVSGVVSVLGRATAKTVYRGDIVAMYPSGYLVLRDNGESACIMHAGSLETIEGIFQ